MTIIDNAIYVDGRRTEDPPSLGETFETMRERHGLAWLDLDLPAPVEIRRVADELGLHHLAVDDAISAHQRAKLERYGDAWFVVLHPARYDDMAERVLLGELHLFVGPDFVVTINHSTLPGLAAGISDVRRRLEDDVDMLRREPLAILYAVLDDVVDRYVPVVVGLQDDIDEVEDQLFDRDPAVSRRIYELSREAIGFQRATHSLRDMLEAFDDGPAAPADVELRRGLRHVHDHTIKLCDHADAFRTLLANALTVDATLVSQQQAEQTKKISSWAAILFTPTLIAGIYGMNFQHIPEIPWRFGYAYALGLMLAVGVTFYVVFKRKGWL